ncbi:MAG: phage antirepressor [Muribaculaceae bacterium]
MSGLQVFKNPTFGQVRTAGSPEEPLFCLSDVCKAVDLTNPSSVKARLDQDEVQLIDLHALNGNQEIIGNSLATFVTESGFYEVILFSNSPKVKPFRRWVTKEVLPSIRRTGSFLSQVPQSFSEALMLAAQQQEEIERQQKLIEAKDRKIAEDAPKVVFSDAVVGSKSSCLIGELAKILTQNGYQIGQNRLFEKLRHDGYLGTKGEYYNIPNQKYVEQGLFEIKKTTHSENGVMKSSVTPKVTGKGQQYFINKYLRGIQTLEFKNE